MSYTVTDGIYGSIHINLATFPPNELPLQQLCELLEEKKNFPKAVFVHVPEKHFYEGQIVSILGDNNFKFHYNRSDDFVFVGGQGAKYVPPACNAHIGVAVILFSEETRSLLMIRECRSVMQDGVPVEIVRIKPVTGSVDVGEPPYVAAHRELAEEVGITLPVYDFESARCIEARASIAGTGFADVCLYYLVRVDRDLEIGNLQKEENIQSCKWIPVGDMAEMDISPTMKRIAQELQEGKLP